MKLEYIAFWVLIALIIGLAVWKMIGSPTDTSSLIAAALFVAGSEVLIWKALFSIDKKASIGFIKIKYDMDKWDNKLDNGINSLNNKLDSNMALLNNKLEGIEKCLKKRK